jgi:hypothetical protein
LHSITDHADCRRTRGPHHDHSEHGSALPLLLLVVVGAALASLWVAQLGGAAVTSSRAQQAADAAALAAAMSGLDADARQLAALNGAVLVAVSLTGDDVRGRDANVRVRVDDVEAIAEAHWDPPPTTTTTTTMTTTTLVTTTTTTSEETPSVVTSTILR